MIKHEVPLEIHHISDAVESARGILNLKDDWDGEGSEGYSEAVWARAMDFLVNHAYWLWEHQHFILDAPRISPGPIGSIDLHWKNKNYELLLNIPRDSGKPASFYGDDFGAMSIKGTLDTSHYNRGVLLWLMNK